MRKAIAISTLSILLLVGCGNKVDGTYAIDVNATKASAEFQANNRQTNGGASLGLQVLSQLAGNLNIEGSKFRMVTLDCKLNSELTKAECSDVSNPAAPKKTLNFSLADGIIKLDSGEGYPVVYKNTKASGSSTKTSSTPTTENPLNKFEGVWHFSLDKSKAANANLAEMEKAAIDGLLLGVAINTSNSAGLKITGGQLQDGNNFCTLDTQSDKDGLFSCINQSDRSIYGKFSMSSSGDLLFNGAGGIQSAVIVFEKKI